MYTHTYTYVGIFFLFTLQSGLVPTLLVFFNKMKNTSDSSEQRKSEGRAWRRVRELNVGDLDSINPQDM